MNFDLRFFLLLLAFGGFVSPSVRAAEKHKLGICDEKTLELLDDAIERECHRYAEGPRLEFEFPEGAGEVGALPAWLEDAEPGLKEAWRHFEKLRSAKIRFYEDLRKAKPKKPGEEINLLEKTDDYIELLRRLLEGEHPPKPEEIFVFHYPWDSFGYCDDPSIEVYANISTDAVILALLRNGQPQETLMRIFAPRCRLIQARHHLLSAFGMDPVEIDIGMWLHGRSSAHESLIECGGERGAKVLVDWSVRNWGRVAEWRRALNPKPPWKGPRFPDYDLLRILAPGNGVSDPTKRKLADLLVWRGAKIHRPGLWLRQLPKGAEPWLAGLARQALYAKLNEDRRIGAKVLRAAGIDVEAPELSPNPKFHITVNGAPWPGTLPDGVRVREPKMRVRFGRLGSIGRGASLRRVEGGDSVFEIDADFFVCKSDAKASLTDAKIYHSPDSIDPSQPWFSASVPLPPAFGKVVDVAIHTRKVTVRPVYDRTLGQLEGFESMIEFKPVEDGRPGGSPDAAYRVPAADPLVLPMVSDGPFWVRVRCEGSEVSEWVRIEVGEGRTDFKIKAPFGATVVVPIEWVGGKMPPMPRWIEQIAPNFGYLAFRQLFLKLKRDGIETAVEKVSETFWDKHPGCVVFPHLPPGVYRVWTKPVPYDPNGGKLFLKPATMRFRIDRNTPPVLKTAPLVLETNRPSEK